MAAQKIDVNKASSRNDSKMCDSFAQILFITRFFGNLVGFDIIHPEYRFGPVTLLVFVISTMGCPTVVYTMISRDRVIMMRACILLGIMFQAFLKVMLIYDNRQNIVDVYYYLKSLFVRNASAKNGNAEILLRWVIRINWMTRVAVVVLVSSFFVFPAHPIIVSGTLLHERDTILPMFYPFIDEKQRFGQCVLLSVHLFHLFMGVMGILAGDLCFWITIMHFCPMAEMWINMLQRLDADVRRVDRCGKADRKRFDTIAMNRCLDNLIVVQNEIFAYMEKLSDMFELGNMTEIGTNAMTLCMIIYVRYFIEWFPLYIFLSVVFMKLFVICLLGTIVDHFYDEMLSAVEQFQWYLMSVQMQRKFLLILLRAQKPTCLIAGTAVVNLDFGVSIMKTVYSVGMLLNEMELK